MFGIINKGVTIDPLVATSPNAGSGYVFDGSDAVEVTLTANPAIDNATFRVVRSRNTDGNNLDPNFKQEGKPKNNPDITAKLEDLSSIHGIPVNNIDSKMQVFGYVIVPWLEDYYGDIFDVNAIEASCHSFMKNVAQNTTIGKGGIGEEHYKFNGNAYPIQSVIDYTGSIGGVPGGWWLGVQITNPETWSLVTSKDYVGFSVGTYVSGCSRFDKEQANKMFLENTAKNIKSIQPKAPELSKVFKYEGVFGYPSDANDYADNVNCKFPINTLDRAFAVTKYLLDSKTLESYTPQETKYLLQRSMQSILNFGYELSDTLIDKYGLTKIDKNDTNNKSIIIKSIDSSIDKSDKAVDDINNTKSMISDIIGAMTSFFSKFNINKSKDINNLEVIDMNKEEFLALLASDEVKTVLFDDIKKSITQLNEKVDSTVAKLEAAKSITVEPEVKEPEVKSINMEELMAKQTSILVDAITKAIKPETAVEPTQPVAKSVEEDPITSKIFSAIDKLDQALAQRATMLGVATVDPSMVQKHQDEEFQRNNPFDGANSIFNVTSRAAVPAYSADTMPIDNTPSTVTKAADLEDIGLPGPLSGVSKKASPFN